MPGSVSQAATISAGSAGMRIARRPVLSADIDHHPTHARVNVQVPMCIGMVERQSRRGERGELRADLGRELPLDARAREISEGETELAGRKPATRVDQIGNFVRRQNGGTGNENQVKPDRKAWIRACPAYGVSGGGAPDHQARARHTPSRYARSTPSLMLSESPKSSAETTTRVLRCCCTLAGPMTSPL